MYTPDAFWESRLVKKLSAAIRSYFWYKSWVVASTCSLSVINGAHMLFLVLFEYFSDIGPDLSITNILKSKLNLVRNSFYHIR